MGLRTRMYLAISLLFGLLFAIFMGITYYFYYRGVIGGVWIIVIPAILAVGIVLLQWGISPLILKWIYKIEWVAGYTPEIDAYIDEVVKKNNIRRPVLGIVRDNNPNAFCFGWTKNRSFLVITEGVLKYCDEEEVKAVVGHELGHIVHNDFVVMTVVSAVPLLFYVIFRGALAFMRGASRSRGRSAGNALLAAAVVAAISFLVYIISHMIALLISRYREYWADRFSAETTGEPNKLSSALVKIAYGLAIEGRGEGADKHHKRYENALMIFNASAARALAVNASDGRGWIDKERIKKAMAWDLWNPWAIFLELKSTHPLPAKRIKALDDYAMAHGKLPYINFDMKKSESYWDEFLEDILISNLWIFSFPLAFLMGYYGNLLLAIGGFFFFLGFFLLIYFVTFKYPLSFKEAKIGELLEDIKVSPVRSRPVILKGRVIGRGVPGLFYSEDLKLDDGTGLILLDYHQVLNFIDFLVGVFATEEKIGESVEVWGWYRRRIVPYVEIFKMRIGGRWKRIYTQILYYIAVVFLILVGAFFLVLSFLF
ncbi:MAG: M48 family metalloprotease [Thermoplasmata archaeon]|nr:M48 family metalloprotease [Thermoplasmata archaeon]